MLYKHTHEHITCSLPERLLCHSKYNAVKTTNNLKRVLPYPLFLHILADRKRKKHGLSTENIVIPNKYKNANVLHDSSLLTFLWYTTVQQHVCKCFSFKNNNNTWYKKSTVALMLIHGVLSIWCEINFTFTVLQHFLWPWVFQNKSLAYVIQPYNPPHPQICQAK